MNVWLGRLVVGMPLARTRLGPSPAPVMPGTLELLLLVILALVSSSSLAISPVGRIRLNSFFFFFILYCNECSGQCGGYSCTANSVCVNTIGSYTCSCNSGYYLSGTTCVGEIFFSGSPAVALLVHFLPSLVLDCNECSGQCGGFTCSASAQCVNTVGSYNCTCNAGYQGNGKTCTGKLPPLSLFVTPCSWIACLEHTHTHCSLTVSHTCALYLSLSLSFSFEIVMNVLVNVEEITVPPRLATARTRWDPSHAPVTLDIREMG